MRKILEENREKVRGRKDEEGLMFECWNVGMLECWNEGLEGLEGLDWKQHEQLVKTTFKRCAG